MSSHARYGPDDEAEALEALKPKVEEEVKLPAAPKPENLVPVDTGPTSSYSFAIDAKSLTVSADYVIRYTIISTSPSGSQNVSHEGIDCKTNQFRRYAYGTKDGKWTPTRSDNWERVSSLSRNQLHFTLGRLYFCQSGLSAGSAEVIIERIRHNRPLSY